MDTRIKLTVTGKKKAQQYINELNAKRKEILDAYPDPADETKIPSISDIENDVAWDIDASKGISFDSDKGLKITYSEYVNAFGVTDDVNADSALVLTINDDFEVIPLLGDFFKWDYLISDDDEKEWWIVVEGKGEMPYELTLANEYSDDECCRVQIDGQYYYFGDNPNARLNLKNKEEGAEEICTNKNMSTSELLINSTLNVKGAILNAQDMISISAHYKRARVQEYVFENANDNITADDALKIADKAIDIMENSHYCEDDAINMARKELGFKKAFFG